MNVYDNLYWKTEQESFSNNQVEDEKVKKVSETQKVKDRTTEKETLGEYDLSESSVTQTRPLFSLKDKIWAHSIHVCVCVEVEM